MTKNYFKKDWYYLLKDLPEEIRGEFTFAFLKYLYEDELTVFDDDENQRMFNIIKTQIDQYKKNYNKDYFYIIKCFNDNETFYKYGVTDHIDLSNRFSFYNSSMPYKYEIILHKHKTELFNPLQIEKKIKKYIKEKRYKPLIKFGGYTECFSLKELDNINKIIHRG